MGLFLAMLELVRLRKIAIKQDELLSDIAIELTIDEESVNAEED